jgi:hypothetical protein
MPEIQGLTERISDLNRSLSHWNNWYVGFVFGTVVLAVAVFVTQVVSMRKSKELAAAQAELIRLKDGQLQIDLRDKDLKIAQANATAGEANERAGRSEKEAARLTRENLQLEAAIAPRRLAGPETTGLSAACRAFAGRSLEVASYILDTEGGVLARQIVGVLGTCGLKVEDRTASLLPVNGFILGVQISGPSQERDLIVGVSKALEQYGHLVMVPPNIAAPGQEGKVIVVVGAKPLPTKLVPN